MNVLNVTSPDINNGNGCRVTVWVAGCRHKCKNCHNKWTWLYEQGTPLSDDKIRNAVFNELSKPYIEGITFSGGDPLDQSLASINELYMFIQEIHERFPDKTIWLYTGYTLEELKGFKKTCIDNVLANIDYLVDGPYIDEQRDLTLPFRGSRNQRIINMKNGES